ncbi:MAG: hypothetical protein QXQ94_05750 [Candidatus Bathyarchaeia archaeon]
MRWKIITLLIITFLIVAWIYLRTIGFLGNWETVIFSLLSIILPLIPYCFQLRVVLKIENARFDKKQVNDSLGYYLTATVLNKGKKIALNIDARFDIKDDSGKTPSLLYVEIETIRGQKIVRTEEKPFNAHIGYAWILEGERYPLRALKELRQNDKVILLFPYHPFEAAVGNKSFSSEYLIRLETGKEY